MSVLRRCIQTTVGLSAGALALGTLAAPIASAAPAPVDTGVGPAEACVPGQTAASARSDEYVRDQGPTAAQVREYEQRFDEEFSDLSPDQRSMARPGGTKTITIPVHVHAIQKTKGQVKGPRKRIVQQIRIMNRAYKGKQSNASVPTKFRFKLKSINRRVNKKWYHAALGDRAAKQMKRKLRKGGKRALNLYLSAPQMSGGTLFGWATFPADRKRNPRLDGVVINYGSMRNGRFDGYNKGDTAVHEIGHWLGLYHTFQGGCSKRNDHVGDTPREESPNYVCPKHRDTCNARGKDPVHNFMDYSYDTCMNQFTFGQSRRMNRQWAAFRAR